ncbi:hypothetical protein C8Q74DRAFT_1221945 [Fomes fomentarius]|nr:hypothetical protein C8Q74DRAFT_1221945 [Fomes fomentarius]
MQSPVNGGSVFRSAHQNDLPGPAQSTPPHATNRPAGISRNAVTGGGDLQAVIEGELGSDHRSKVSTEPYDGAGLPTSTGASTQEKPSVRIRRSAWQTMQEHLAGGGKESRLRKHREEASAPDLVPSQEHRDRSQAPATSASVPRDNALSPEAAAPARPSDDAVPSLLLRLSDPVPDVSVHPQNANAADGGPGARRGTLSAPKGGKGISVPDITTRTRARSARTSAGEDRSAASQLPPSTHDPGAAGCDSSAKHVAGGTGDVGPVAALEPMSSASEGPAAQPETGPGRGAQAATGSSSDPRFLLVEKLKVEKRKARASAVPTAEKTQLSPPAGGSTPGDSGSPAVPMGLLSDGTSARLTKSAPAGVEVVAAARNAERREAELRSQAQLRQCCCCCCCFGDERSGEWIIRVCVCRRKY